MDWFYKLPMSACIALGCLTGLAIGIIPLFIARFTYIIVGSVVCIGMVRLLRDIRRDIEELHKD